MPKITMVLKEGPELERLEKLAARCGTTVNGQLVNYALSTLEWIAQMIERGYTVEAVNYEQRHHTTLSLPFLPINTPEPDADKRVSPFMVIEGGKKES